MVLVVDTSSILDFNKFYIFDKNNSSEVYDKLTGFLLEKIKSGEIIIIDKVYDEINDNHFTQGLKRTIKDYCSDSLHLFEKVQELIAGHTKQENINLLDLSDAEVEQTLSLYENKHADLYLVAKCLELKQEGKDPVLITEETMTNDGKIVDKLPTICKMENVRFQKVPHALFEIYKHELRFALEIE